MSMIILGLFVTATSSCGWSFTEVYIEVWKVHYIPALWNLE